MNTIHRAPAMVAMIVLAVGCQPKADSGPFGPAGGSPLLAPFAGQWAFDLEKTLAAWKAAGMTEEAIEQARGFHASLSQFGGLQQDLTIEGDVAVGAGMPSAEYRFFAMHPHAGAVCGKAWHHEDRFDPGDMSKCYVRLRLKGADLHLEVRMQDGLPDLNDPDFGSEPSAEGGSADACDADHPPGGDWSPWTTYVFSRK